VDAQEGRVELAGRARYLAARAAFRRGGLERRGGPQAWRGGPGAPARAGASPKQATDGGAALNRVFQGRLRIPLLDTLQQG
jgi:hypothetical protein